MSFHVTCSRSACCATSTWREVNRDVTTLISAGTAICGGSAIAAIAPAIRAKAHDISVSLAVVFALNSLALLIFPAIGHALELSERQFGLWCALAIHDTSSVVGASVAFGNRALEVATTVKLARALWIVPVTFLIGAMCARRDTVAAEPVSEENRGNPGVGARQYPLVHPRFSGDGGIFHGVAITARVEPRHRHSLPSGARRHVISHRPGS